MCIYVFKYEYKYVQAHIYAPGMCNVHMYYMEI